MGLLTEASVKEHAVGPVRDFVLSNFIGTTSASAYGVPVLDAGTTAEGSATAQAGYGRLGGAVNVSRPTASTDPAAPWYQLTAYADMWFDDWIVISDPLRTYTDGALECDVLVDGRATRTASPYAQPSMSWTVYVGGGTRTDGGASR